MSNTIDSATCPTTNRPRHPNRSRGLSPGLLTASPPPRKTPARSGLDAASEGTSPNSTTVRIESATANAKTAPSIRISPVRGSSTKVILLMVRKLTAAKAIPNVPPTDASNKLSASNCPTIRPRPAPIAARTANSREREVARASSRPAKFAHTMSKTNPTAPNSIHNFGRMSDTSTSFRGRTGSVEFGFASSISGCAWAY